MIGKSDKEIIDTSPLLNVANKMFYKKFLEKYSNDVKSFAKLNMYNKETKKQVIERLERVAASYNMSTQTNAKLERENKELKDNIFKLSRKITHLKESNNKLCRAISEMAQALAELGDNE